MGHITTSAYNQSSNGPTSRVHKTAEEQEQKQKQSNPMMIVILIIILLLLLWFFMMKKQVLTGGDLFLTDTNGFSATSE